jgi:MoaA/NifB/PqqE/SkfB family radical SAM enzyme
MKLNQSDLYTYVLNWVEKNVFPPKHIQVIPTNACNINCIFCWERIRWKKGTKKDRISDERLLELTKEFCQPSLRPKQVTITGGGEPLLKKEVVLKMIKEIKKHSIKCEVITNGTLFDEKSAKRMISNKLDNLIISVNSADPKIDDFLHGAPGAHKKILEGLKLFMKLKKKKCSELPRLRFNVVITKYNYIGISNIVKMAAEYNVDEVFLRLVTEPPFKGKPGKLSVPREEYDKFLEEIKQAEKIASSLKVSFQKIFDERDVEKYFNLTPEEDAKLSLINPLDEESIIETLESENAFEKLCQRGICTFPFYELYIDSNGHVSGCGTHASAGRKSNFAEDVINKSLMKIWYGKKLNQLRARMVLCQFPKECSTCNFINQLKINREWYIF